MATSCPKCSRPNQDGRAVCLYCGAPISLVQCPGCSRPNRQSNKICSYCGAGLADEADGGEAAAAAGGVVGGAATSCSKCSRPLQRNSLRCVYCGTPAPQPQDEAAAGSGGPYRVTCSGCDGDFLWDDVRVEKMLRARQSACLECGGQLQMPQVLRDRFRKTLMQQGAGSVRCPGCDRPIPPRGDDRPTLSCQYCGLRCLPPAQGEDRPRMGPAGGGPLADPEAARRMAEQLDPSAQNQLLLQALAARTRAREVLASEPAALVLAKYRLDRWRDAPGVPYLPLPADEVARLVPPVFFGSGHHFTEQRGGHTEVVITLKLGDDRKQVSGSQVRSVVESVVGLGALAVLGVGSISMPGSSDVDTMRTAVQHRMRMTLFTEQDGTHMAFSQQVDDGAPVPLGPRTLMRIGRQLFLMRPVFMAYYTLLAIYGPWASGLPAMRVTRPALVGRLRALGLAEQEAQQHAGALLAALKSRQD